MNEGICKHAHIGLVLLIVVCFSSSNNYFWTGKIKQIITKKQRGPSGIKLGTYEMPPGNEEDIWIYRKRSLSPHQVYTTNRHLNYHTHLLIIGAIVIGTLSQFKLNYHIFSLFIILFLRRRVRFILKGI